MKKIILCSFLVAICLILEASASCNCEDKELQTGEVITISSCVQVTCNTDGSVTGLTCKWASCGGKPIAPPEQDLSKPYPMCCPRPRCRN